MRLVIIQIFIIIIMTTILSCNNKSKDKNKSSVNISSSKNIDLTKEDKKDDENCTLESNMKKQLEADLKKAKEGKAFNLQGSSDCQVK